MNKYYILNKEIRKTRCNLEYIEVLNTIGSGFIDVMLTIKKSLLP